MPAIGVPKTWTFGGGAEDMALYGEARCARFQTSSLLFLGRGTGRRVGYETLVELAAAEQYPGAVGVGLDVSLFFSSQAGDVLEG